MLHYWSWAWLWYHFCQPGQPKFGHLLLDLHHGCKICCLLCNIWIWMVDSCVACVWAVATAGAVWVTAVRWDMISCMYTAAFVIVVVFTWRFGYVISVSGSPWCVTSWCIPPSLAWIVSPCPSLCKLFQIFLFMTVMANWISGWALLIVFLILFAIVGTSVFDVKWATWFSYSVKCLGFFLSL